MATGYLLSAVGTTLQYLSDQGVVLAGGTVSTFVAGTSTPVVTYTDSTLGVSNGTVITLNSNGRLPASCWVGTGVTIKMVLKDALGNTVANGTVDNLQGINDPFFASPFASLTTNEITNGITITQINGQYAPGDIRRYKAKVDNTTDDTGAINLANSSGEYVYYPEGTALASSNITSFHQTQKWGPGKVRRGASTFTIAALSTTTNNLFVATTGNDANDGIDSTTPMLTLQHAADVLALYGPVLPGQWQINTTAASFSGNFTLAPELQAANYVRVWGPTGAAPFVPTFVLDGSGGATFAVQCGGRNIIHLRDCYLKNWTNAGNGFGVVTQEFGKILLENVWILNCDNAIKVEEGRVYMIGGFVQGGVVGFTAISGEEHSLGYNATAQCPSNVVTTAASSAAGTATLTFAAQPSAPIVGSYLIVTGVTPSGFNGTYAITASTTTTVSYANGTAGPQTVAGKLVYNIGAAGYGPVFTGQSQCGIYAQENATGHADYTVVCNSTVNAQIYASSRFNLNNTTLCSATVGIRTQMSGHWNDGGLTIYDCTSPTLVGSFGGDINRSGNYTSCLQMPVDLTFVSDTGPFAAKTEKTVTAFLPHDRFVARTGRGEIRVNGTITGVAGTKTFTINVNSSLMAQIVVPAAVAGPYVLEFRLNANASASAQDYDMIIWVDSNTPQAVNGSRSISMSTGVDINADIQLALAGADTVTFRKVIPYNWGL